MAGTTSLRMARIDTKGSASRGAQNLVPILLAVVLFAAAFLKGFELATEELSGNSVFTSRWVLMLLVLFELGLACWLVGGLHVRGTRSLLLLTFLGFFETALFLAAAGYGSCHCLGRSSLSPWVAAAFDAAAIAAIVIWQPAGGGPSVFSHPRRFMLVGLVYVIAAFPALASMINYTPSGQMPLLRNDLLLASRVKIQSKEVSPQQLVDQLHAATGQTFSIEDSLAASWPTSLREINTNGTPAWAFMELLAHKQSVPVRWEKVEGGYRLVPSAPLGTRTPWLISGAFLIVLGGYLLFTRQRPATSPGGGAASDAGPNPASTTP